MEAAVCSYEPQIIVTSASGGKVERVLALRAGALLAGCKTQTIILGAGAVES